MKHIVITDNNNYVIGLDLSKAKNAVVVPEEVLTSRDLTCYKYINKEFIFDDAKKQRLEDEEKQRQEAEKLKPTTEDLAIALDILTDIVLGE